MAPKGDTPLGQLPWELPGWALCLVRVWEVNRAGPSVLAAGAPRAQAGPEPLGRAWALAFISYAGLWCTESLGALAVRGVGWVWAGRGRAAGQGRAWSREAPTFEEAGQGPKGGAAVTRRAGKLLEEPRTQPGGAAVQSPLDPALWKDATCLPFPGPGQHITRCWAVVLAAPGVSEAGAGPSGGRGGSTGSSMGQGTRTRPGKYRLVLGDSTAQSWRAAGWGQ